MDAEVLDGTVVDGDPVADEGERVIATDQPAEDAEVVDEVVAVDAGDPVTASGMMPGEANLNGGPAAVTDDAGLHDRWQQAQLGFIDDPYAAAAEARSIAESAIEAHVEALRARQSQLDAWQSDAQPDTEVLRAAMQGYRDLVTSLVEE